jgi:hypothetical protein
MEQWTVRGCPNGMAMFHKDNCRCCNEYVAHTIRACKEQHLDLHMQDVSDTVTTAWLKLMHDLERGQLECLDRLQGTRRRGGEPTGSPQDLPIHTHQ